jgi:SAM-dependent methyltransferase
MIYINGLSEDHGTLEIGSSILNNHPEGTVVIFKNSDVLHSGVPGKTTDRLVVEVTLMRSLVTTKQLNQSHFNGRHLKSPDLLYSLVGQKLESVERQTVSTFETCEEQATKKYINIGSGVRDWENWLLLDQIRHPNIHYFEVSPQCSLPVSNNEASLIYSSHHFEHISTASIMRLLSESSRALKSGGILILKYPDFEWFLEQYASGNVAAMMKKGVEKVLWSWKNFGVSPSFTNFTAMMFCGYWNCHYGDHFSRQINHSPLAYHGPPRVPEAELHQLLLTGNVQMISKTLNYYAKQDPDFCAFNHQNAWPVEWMVERVTDTGLTLKSTEKDYIRTSFAEIIPDFDDMYGVAISAL